MTGRLIAIAIVLLFSLRAQQAPAHVQAAVNSLQRGDVEGAIREAKAALAGDPQDAAAHMLLGQAYMAQRSVAMLAEAKAELQQAIDLDPKLLWARFYLSKIYIDLGLFDKAREQLRRGLESRPDVPHFLSLLGEVERKLGHPETSLDLNRRALAGDPSLTPAHYYIALAQLDLNHEDLAIGELESALASPYVAPEFYVTLAHLYLGRGRTKDAEALCKKAAALDGSRAETLIELARVYNAQSSSDQAIAALKLALPEGRSFPATTYYQQLQADAYFELGRAYETKRVKVRAVEAYQRSLDLDPGREEARRRLRTLGSAPGVRHIQ